jgi:hypothetical protein
LSQPIIMAVVALAVGGALALLPIWKEIRLAAASVKRGFEGKGSKCLPYKITSPISYRPKY